MIRPERPVNEAQRLAALQRARILDTPEEPAFDDLVRIAAAICRVPMATVSLVDAERQWLKARVGMEVSAAARDDAFCAHTILDPARPMVVRDALEDSRFSDKPCVRGEPSIRFYAGVALIDPQGFPLGSLCVMDRKPRELDGDQENALQALSRLTARLIELHRLGLELGHHLSERDWYEQQLRQHQNELEQRNADLAALSRTDALTSLPNRRAFGESLERAAAAGEPYAVAICDIDHFNTINDTHGHPEGDRVLCAVADALRGHHPARGRVARFGGDEFVLLFPGADRDEAAGQCEALRALVVRLPVGMPLSVSIGVAERAPGEHGELALARADAALYAAKRSGRDRVEVG